MCVVGRYHFSGSLSFLTLVLVQHKACMYSPQKLSDDISLNKDYGGLLSTNLCEVVFLPYLRYLNTI